MVLVNESTMCLRSWQKRIKLFKVDMDKNEKVAASHFLIKSTKYHTQIGKYRIDTAISHAPKKGQCESIFLMALFAFKDYGNGHNPKINERRQSYG